MSIKSSTRRTSAPTTPITKPSVSRGLILCVGIAVLDLSLLAACTTYTTKPGVTSLSSSEGPMGSASANQGGALGQADAAEVVVYDPRRSQSDPRIGARVSKSDETQLLARLFPKYLSDSAQCPPDAMSMDEARVRGAFAPQVLGVTEGAFTTAGTSQKLYRVFVGECNASDADDGGTGLLVVTQGDIVLVRAPVGRTAFPMALFDLDGDGKNEVLLESGYTNGIQEDFAELVRFDGKALTTIRSFGQVGEDNCAFGDEHPYNKFTVVRAIIKPGAETEFILEKNEGTCD